MSKRCDERLASKGGEIFSNPHLSNSTHRLKATEQRRHKNEENPRHIF
jgi:hypothetical protein